MKTSRMRKSPKGKSSRRRKSPKGKSSRRRKSTAVCNIDPSKLPDKMPKRKAPPMPSAPCFESGVFKGNDGGEWVVKKTGEFFRWVKYSGDDDWSTD
jgi:hypothetical protein